MSLSARRAWIEIPAGCWRDARRVVALRKESVDRNIPSHWMMSRTLGSLSARRAWIEIDAMKTALAMAAVALRKESVDRNKGDQLQSGRNGVALRKESVDRNSSGAKADSVSQCRSPQGERG